MNEVVARAGKPFPRLLGPAFISLPLAVRTLHGLDAAQATAGRADIVAEPGLLRWLLCAFAGLPRPGRDVPVAVRFIPAADGTERWERQFADRRYASRMTVGTGRDDGHLVEHFGMFDLVFALTGGPQGLDWTLKRWRWLKIPLPAWSLPRIACREAGDATRFTFDIDVAFPFLGPVLRYKGWLEPIPSPLGAPRGGETA